MYMYFSRLLSLFIENFDQPALRAIRVLRPLKLVTGFESKWRHCLPPWHPTPYMATLLHGCETRPHTSPAYRSSLLISYHSSSSHHNKHVSSHTFVQPAEVWSCLQYHVSCRVLLSCFYRITLSGVIAACLSLPLSPCLSPTLCLFFP